MSLTEQSQALDTEIRSTVERSVEELRRELRRRFEDVLAEANLSLPDTLLSEDRLADVVQPAVDSALAERPAEPAPAADATELRDALARIDAARTQADVLRSLAEEAARFGSRSAVFLIRGDDVRGWGGQGFETDWSSHRVDASQGAWHRLTDDQGPQTLSSSERADLASRLDAPVAGDAVLIPLVLRDRVAAALYVDRVGDDTLDVPALQSLAYVGALAIETLPLRSRHATSTLAVSAGAAPTPEPSLPQPSPEIVAEPEPEPEPEPEVEIEVDDEDSELTVSEDTDFGADLGEVDLAVEEDVPEEETVPEVDEIDEDGAAETVGWKVEAPEPPPAAAEPEPEPEPEAVEPEPVEDTPTATEPATEAEPPGEDATPAAAKSPTPQVQPPEDVQGPGWAFSSTPQQKMDDEEEARHEEARRLARLLISEIKLYNEDQVQEGRKNNNVVERLKEDIDRSRQLYEERVDPRVRDKTDYFYQEMVRLLGAGDPKTLGI